MDRGRRGPERPGRLVELVNEQLVGSAAADEWNYVTRGTAEFTVGDEIIRGTPGSALWMPISTPHRIHNDADETLEFLWGFDRPRLDEVGIVWGRVIGPGCRRPRRWASLAPAT